LAIQQRHQRRIGLGLERLGLLPLRFPILFLLLIAAITAGSVFGYNRLKVEDSLTELFRTDTPEFHTYETLTERFPSSEFDVLVVIEGEELLTRPALQTLRDLVLELQFVEEQRGIVSMFSARQPPSKEDAIPPPLFPAELPEGEAFDALIKKVRENEILRDKLLSPDGTLSLIVIALDRQAVREQGLRAVVGEIERLVEDSLQGTGLTAQLSGAPVMQLEIRNAVERDRLIYNGLGFAIGALIALVFFRRLSLVAIAAGPPALAILWSLGALGWMNFRLNLFLNVMSPLIMVMAFSDTMQITFAMRDRLVAGDDKRTALRFAILRVGPACVLTVATAAASFITLLISDSALIRTFGAAGALSTAIAYVAVITLVPLLGMLLLGNDHSKLRKDGAGHDRPMKALRGLCEWIADGVTARPIFFASLSAVLIVTMGAAYLSLEPRYRLADQVPDREQALEASSRLDKKLTGANPVHILIEFERGQDVYDPRTLEMIGKVNRLVQRQPKIGNVWSLETLREWMKRSEDYSIAKLKQYVEILPEHLVRRFLAEDGQSVVVTGRVPDIDASRLLPVIDSIDAKLDDIRRQYPGYEISVTGLPAIAARNSADMINQLSRGLSAEMLVVALMIALAFRSIIIGAVAALPGLFPIFASGALLAFTGEGLQFASIVALTVAFGLGLDATIHYLNRLQQEDRPGADPVEVIKRATVLIGPALMLTTIVLACGLAVTVFSDLPSLRLFGRLAAITLIAALIGDLMILPSTMLLIRRLRQREPTKGSEKT
jgi:predicted RND superfamily exporter protein